MKHIFIVNPHSGNGKTAKLVESEISKFKNDLDADIYFTKGIGDSEKYIKRYMAENNEKVRFYACGGDGTVNEVVNGIAGSDSASFAVYPCGSGNDFVKCFGGKENLMDIRELIESDEIPIDVIKVNERYCVNVCHFGFDTYVAKKMNKVKEKPVIGGKNAYTTGVVMGLVYAMKSEASIICDGEKLNNGVFLLCTIGNGRYVGGKYKCAPRAVLNDGIMEVCLVDPVSRLKFIKLVGAYAEGKHLDDPRFKSFVHYRQCKHIEIDADDDFEVSLDGEVTPAAHAQIDIIPGGINIALPKKALQYGTILNTKNEAFSKKI